MKTYNCSWSTSTIIITIIIIAITIGCIIWLIRSTAFTKQFYTLLVVSILLSASVVITFLYTPSKLSITNTQLVIHKFMSDENIPLIKIQGVSPYQGIKGDIRVFGSGGLFGNIGLYKNPKLGKYHMYVTNTSEMFVLKIDGKYLVLSCDNRDEAISVISKELTYKR